MLLHIFREPHGEHKYCHRPVYHYRQDEVSAVTCGTHRYGAMRSRSLYTVTDRLHTRVYLRHNAHAKGIVSSV
jgi:hypothetical protein